MFQAVCGRALPFGRTGRSGDRSLCGMGGMASAEICQDAQRESEVNEEVRSYIKKRSVFFCLITYRERKNETVENGRHFRDMR